MSDSLKKLLERMGIDLDMLQPGHVDCNVEQDIARLQGAIVEIPSADASSSALVQFSLTTLRIAAKSMLKEARKKELEIEIHMLDKPDEVDLESDEYKHHALHIEHDKLSITCSQKHGNAMLRFCDFVEDHVSFEDN